MLAIRSVLRLAAVLVCAALAAARPAHAEPAPDYYDTVDASSAAVLRATLHAVIRDHVKVPYSSSALDTWDVLEWADENPEQTSEILDIYRNASYPKHGGGNSKYNREHAWPKSYGFPIDGAGNYPYTDCHHLFLVDSAYNSARNNKPYARCGPSCAEKPIATSGTGVYPGSSNWTAGSGARGTWETWIGRRGDVARALMYMDVRYEGGVHGVTGATEPDLILTDDRALIASTSANAAVAYMGLLSVLLEWHRHDPVDDLERRRNDRVEAAQGNRNPFIDHPEWAECVFADRCPGSRSDDQARP
jgi:endonuclease I